jgi:hypothetical protein
LDSSIGAIAGLIDIACLYGTDDFAKSQDDVYNVWEKYSGSNPYEVILDFVTDVNITSLIVGIHYFIKYGDTILPEFDFTSAGPTEGNPDAFVVGTKVVDVAAPDSVHDIDWLELNAVSGKYADKVYRIETRGGQPPASVSSVRLYFDLLQVVQPSGLLRSAPLDQIRSLSIMLHNTVSEHSPTIIGCWLLTSCI